ncbi:MAG: N-acetyltransferase family protein [Alphaproteobacteria bacterium]|nr:N-acetyltransferase family protein [Alphaproteobacteria bacterium]
MSAATIRPATPADLPEIQRIYGHHVLNGLASFEEIAPDLAEMTRRYTALIEAGYPYIVAELDGKVVGYAYCGPYRPRPAYRYSVENSVYLAPEAARKGIGRTLLTALIERATALGKRQMVAVIGDSANHASIGLHESLGFRRVGTIEGAGFKHGRWVDSVLMQRALGLGLTQPPSA